MSAPHRPRDSARRDFLHVATGSTLAVGTAFIVWPPVDSRYAGANRVMIMRAKEDVRKVGTKHWAHRDADKASIRANFLRLVLGAASRDSVVLEKETCHAAISA
jgi:hypothetical protein